MINWIRRLFIIWIVSVFFFSCNRDDFSSGKLSFSSDTVFFDTLFSGVLSYYQILKVYNFNNQDIKLDNIILASGGYCGFKLYIDGQEDVVFSNKIIRQGDSLYLFIEFKKQADSLFQELKDSIIFYSGENIQDVKLRANLLDADKTTGVIRFTKDTIISQVKPQLVFDSIIIEDGVNVIFDKNTQYYFYKNSGIYIKGSVEMRGTTDFPIVLRSHRLDEVYKDVPGWWNGVYVLGNDSCVFENVYINQAINGIFAGNLHDLTKHSNIVLKNCKIENISETGLAAIGGSVKAENLLITDCGDYAFLGIGGDFTFTHITIANYYPSSYSVRNNSSVTLSNSYYAYGDNYSGPLNATFNNSIIYGDNFEEFFVDNPEDVLNYNLNYCIVRLDENNYPTTNSSIFNNVIINEDPKFEDIEEELYIPDSLSVAIDAGGTGYVNGVFNDLNGKSRINDEGPDIGAFETDY